MAAFEEYIEVYGARSHNLKNIDVRIPRNQLVVITGLSGSGKSSLAFDTIYAEGQRRYIETFSAYARQFLGGLERPDVDKIDGLSPVIAIEQKTTSRSPRSTVGTITEIYDFLRLLYARVAEAYSFHTGEKMVSYTDEQIMTLIQNDFKGKKINILAPVIRARKGHYRELFQQIAKKGFVKVRVDGEIRDIEQGMKLDRYKTHDIEIVIDRMLIGQTKEQDKRLLQSIDMAMSHGEDVLMVIEDGADRVRYFSRTLMDPVSGISYPNPEPNTFSFNSPKGACEHCNGIGIVYRVNVDKIIPDKNKSIAEGGLEPYGIPKKNWIYHQLRLVAERYHFKLTDKLKDVPEEALDLLLHGGKEKLEVDSEQLGVKRNYRIDFEGVANFIEQSYHNNDSTKLRRWAKKYMDKVQCPECEGSRLKKQSLYFKLDGLNISEVADKDIADLSRWFEHLPEKLNENKERSARISSRKSVPGFVF